MDGACLVTHVLPMAFCPGTFAHDHDARHEESEMRMSTATQEKLDTGFETTGIERVPETERAHTQLWDTMWLWWSANSVVATVALGALSFFSAWDSGVPSSSSSHSTFLASFPSHFSVRSAPRPGWRRCPSPVSPSATTARCCQHSSTCWPESAGALSTRSSAPVCSSPGAQAQFRSGPRCSSSPRSRPW